MGKITVTIVGLGRIGTSVGLALKRYNTRPGARHQFEVNGADDRAAVAKEAANLKAVDKTVRNMVDAVSDRDIIVLDAPFADMRHIYQSIGSAVRDGAVILDMSTLKTPALEWANKYVKDSAYVVGIAPIINPEYLFDGIDDTLHAREDLFDKGTMLLMPHAGVERAAVELASDFSSVLGAKVHFMDPHEYDTLAAATANLPALLGIAGFYMLSNNPGWGDIQRITNPDFGRLTHHLFDTHPDDLRDEWLHNRESLVRYTDQVIDALQQFRDLLATNDRAAVEATLSQSADAYSTWINRRYKNDWDDDNPQLNAPSPGETLMSGLMGSFITRRLRGEKDKD